MRGRGSGLFLNSMKETPVLYSNRLILRPFSVTDANDVYEWCSSLNVTKYLFWYPHRDKEVTIRLLKNWERKKRNYSWCLEYQKKAIGEIEVIKDLPEAGFEIGYTLNDRYWRNGFMKEALDCVLRFLFLENNYEYVIAVTDKRNLSSIALLESFGFVLQNEAEGSDYYIAKKDEHIKILAYRFGKELFLQKKNR